MNNNNFDLEIICQGACIDKDEAEDFLIETKTFRLNHIALNEWTLSEMMNSRECYAAGPAGDEEWREHKSEYTEKRRIATQHIINALNFAKREGSISITQAMAEIFIAVRISRVSGNNED